MGAAVLTEEMRRLVRQQKLGFVATVCPDGTPNLSSKGTTTAGVDPEDIQVWDDHTLVFAHIRSPRTVLNLGQNPAIEVNVVDPFTRKGFRFKGAAAVHTEGPTFERGVAFYERAGVADARRRIQAIVLVQVERAAPLVSPAYDGGEAEAAVQARWLRYHTSLVGVLPVATTPAAAPAAGVRAAGHEAPPAAGAGSAYTVRPAAPADAPAIATIYNQGIEDRVATFETEPRSSRQIEAMLRERGERYPTVVVEREGRVVAWAGVSSYRARPCYDGVGEFSVYVAREARGAGAGRAALRGLLEACERRGFWKLVSRVFPENAASRALCRALGFREVGTYERHARLDGVWRDCVVVEKLLGEAAAPAAPPVER